MRWNRHFQIIFAILLNSIWFVSCFDVVRAEGTSPSVPIVPVPYYAPPDRIDFCGESVPLDSPEVRERFDREFTIVVYSHAQVYLWLKRAERYFPRIEKELAVHKLPEDLKYVAVAESDLMAMACSPAGAVGPWQFISSTGRNYGLSQTGEIDERHDFDMAMASAFRYLKDLHGLFGNWTLAVAAYNCGERRIASEMERQKVRDYYSLKLPLETERYIFRILAIKAVLSSPEQYGYQLPKGGGYPEVPVDLVRVRLSHRMPLQMVADAAGMTYREFKVLNPFLVSNTIPEGQFTLKVHRGKGTQFQKRLAAAQAEYVPKSVAHKVSKGETLSGIARKYNVSMQDLRKWNRIRGDTVRIGQVLKIVR